MLYPEVDLKGWWIPDGIDDNPHRLTTRPRFFEHLCGDQMLLENLLITFTNHSMLLAYIQVIY